MTAPRCGSDEASLTNMTLMPHRSGTHRGLTSLEIVKVTLSAGSVTQEEEANSYEAGQGRSAAVAIKEEVVEGQSCTVPL